MTTEVLFYHLTRQPLEEVLPGLLLKCLERDWKVVVQCGSEERCAALDAHLWSFSDHEFLPHGTIADGFPEHQPVFLTAGPDNPNSAEVRFLVDRAVPPPIDGYGRVVVMFDGNDQEALADARQHWKLFKGQGAEVTYWQQRDGGGWERKA
ncbi:DNA polymerase III subunit chi [Pannonibacter phragmitetus]|uniref:DNA polymerase III subunit chi n=1 Tax=Pannonibacter phragmitetus TaxID=121719 RepID=UPI003D2EB9E4